MSFTDQKFPVIIYESGKSSRDWGHAHGECLRQGIRELVEIRRELLVERGSGLSDQVVEKLARKQFMATQKFSKELSEELEGIAEGADVSVEDLVVLNNYTDFKDLQIADQGCTTVFAETKSELLAGQTWDMHRSAKNYVCVIQIASQNGDPDQLVYSLVGCLGLMGYNSNRLMLGVNNLPTKNAVPGIVWPALVREILKKNAHSKAEELLKLAPVTSGHNYLLASHEKAQMWEVTPSVREKVSEHLCGTEGHIFHTNHCLGTQTKPLEISEQVSGTTLERYRLAKKKLPATKNFDSIISVLNDHEEFPKSLCCHFESGLKDPSFTCGGSMGDLRSLKVSFWRGCAEKDSNFRRRDFEFDGKFKMVREGGR